jgi:hypothetical protein
MISSFMEVQECALPELEDINQAPFEIIEVPEPNQDHIESQKRVERQKNIGMLEQKISYLRNILIYNQYHQNYSLSDDLKNYIRVSEETFIANKDRLPVYANAQPAENLIREKIPTIQQIDVAKETTTRDEDIKKALIDKFKKNKGNKVCISASHGATWFNLEAAHEAKEDQSAEIGVIVFDNHTDLYTGEKDVKPNLWKGNVFRLLGNNGTIKRAIFFGGVDDLDMVVEENNQAKKENKAVEYHQTKIDFLKKEGKTKRPRLLEFLDAAIKEYKNDGITNVVFSIDMDVLRVGRVGYTALEYSPIDALNYVSSLKLPLDKNPSELTQSDIDTLAEQIPEKNNWTKYLNRWNPSGLTLGDLGVSLDTITQSCKKHGLNFGIKLTGGGTYFGDVVEMSGPDYKERTTTSSTLLLKRIERIVQNDILKQVA